MSQTNKLYEDLFSRMIPDDLDLDTEALGSVDLEALAQQMKDYATDSVLLGSLEDPGSSIRSLSAVDFLEIAERFVEAHSVVSDEKRSFGGR